MLKNFPSANFINIKEVFLYSLSNALFSIIIIILNYLFKCNYQYNSIITKIALLRFFIISFFIFIYYSFIKKKIKINYDKLFFIAIIIDLILILIFHPFNNIFIYTKISCISTIIPLYLITKFDIFICKINKYLKKIMNAKTYTRFKYLIYFIFFTNPILFVAFILMFISYDFLIDDIIITVAFSILLYSFIKFFIGLCLAYILSKKIFYKKYILTKTNIIFIYCIFIDLIILIAYYLLNDTLYNSDIIGYIFNFSLSFAFLPFYIFYLINKFSQKQNYSI